MDKQNEIGPAEEKAERPTDREKALSGQFEDPDMDFLFEEEKKAG